MAPKKSFKENPALQFISSSAVNNTQDTLNTYDTHDKQQSENLGGKKERKSKRLNLLLQPSMLEDLSKIAYMKQTSVNDLINTIIKDYSSEHADVVSWYNQIFTENGQ